MLVGTRDHRHADHAGDDARQRAFHAGDDDDDARRRRVGALRQHAMDAGDADVVDAVDGVAQQLGRHRRFFGDRDVGRCPPSRARSCPCRAAHVALHGYAPRQLVILGRRARRVLTAFQAASSARVTSSGCPRPTISRGDRRDLVGCLAQTQDDFGKALPDGPMVIDLGKPKVLKGLVAKRGQDLASAASARSVRPSRTCSKV